MSQDHASGVRIAGLTLGLACRWSGRREPPGIRSGSLVTNNRNQLSRKQETPRSGGCGWHDGVWERDWSQGCPVTGFQGAANRKVSWAPHWRVTSREPGCRQAGPTPASWLAVPPGPSTVGGTFPKGNQGSRVKRRG